MTSVSVVLPVYNAARYLESALASIWAQSFSDFEVIAVDDGSKDRTKAILERIARRESRLRVLSRPNTGIVGALNDSMNLASGKYLARMDADDWSLPDRFSRQVAYLESHPDCVALGTDVLFTDPEGAPLMRRRPAPDHEGIVAELMDGNGGALIHPSVIFRREAVERLGGYREEFNFIEDLDLFLRLSEVGKLANLPEVLLHYRQHLQSVNRTRGNREDMRRQIVAPYRTRCGLAELPPAVLDPDAPRCPADWRRHWAYEAAQGGHWNSARKNAWLACWWRPLERRNWQCLRYILSATREAALAAAA